jgi:hypothetical protein
MSDVTIKLPESLADALWAALNSQRSTPQATAPSSPAPTGAPAAPAPATLFPASDAVVGWAVQMVKGGKTPAEAVAVIQAQWAKDGHHETLVLSANDPRLTAAVPAASPEEALRKMQQGLADAAPAGRGKPPPIIPPHLFNPALSLVGIPQVWYYDEPNGGWPAASADQTQKEGVRVFMATSPLTGYFADKAAVDAMPPPTVSAGWAAAEANMRASAGGAAGVPVPAIPPTAPAVVEASGNAP